MRSADRMANTVWLDHLAVLPEDMERTIEKLREHVSMHPVAYLAECEGMYVVVDHVPTGFAVRAYAPKDSTLPLHQRVSVAAVGRDLEHTAWWVAMLRAELLSGVRPWGCRGLVYHWQVPS